ncbi:hypothetical protein AAC387_Pa01g0370 [Persea americana]
MLLASLIFSFPVENTTVDSPSSLHNRWQFSLQLFQATNFSPRPVSNQSIQIRSVKMIAHHKIFKSIKETEDCGIANSICSVGSLIYKVPSRSFLLPKGVIS